MAAAFRASLLDRLSSWLGFLVGLEVMDDGRADEVFVLGSDLGTTAVRQQSRYALARERLIEAAGGAANPNVPAIGGSPAMPAVRK